VDRHAQTIQPKTATRTVAAARAEHISLQSDPDALAAPARQPRRKIRSAYSLHSRLRGCATELAILDDHYLRVHSVRPHAEPKHYEIDLRFISAKPVRARHVSWFWLVLAFGLALLAVGAIWTSTRAGVRWTGAVFLTAAATLIASFGAMFMFLRRTIESLEFLSVHGGATLVSVTGGIGSARKDKKFFIELIKNINAAKAARPQLKPQFLRDEMRASPTARAGRAHARAVRGKQDQNPRLTLRL
jgi:hypothetical protein